MIQFYVPLKPISTNDIWMIRNNRMIATTAYKNYARDLALLIPKGKRFEGDVELTIEFFLKSKRRRDLDNMLKGTLDVMTKVGVYNDDSQIVALHAHKSYADEDGMRITIAEA